MGSTFRTTIKKKCIRLVGFLERSSAKDGPIIRKLNLVALGRLALHQTTGGVKDLDNVERLIHLGGRKSSQFTSFRLISREGAIL